jgi:glycosyltransferase involved in cell wall biosynthesis
MDAVGIDGISFVIPAFNEERLLINTIDSIRNGVEGIDRIYEIIVVDNNSTDRTSEIAKEQGARVVFEPHNQISRARNAGAREAKYEYLIFVDADTVINHDLLIETLVNLDSGKCCGGGAMMNFDLPVQKIYHYVLDTFHYFARQFNWAAGCYVYCWKSAFEDIGGFSDKLYASEEILFSRNLVKWGRRRNMEFRLIQEAKVITSTRKFDNPTKLILLMSLYLLMPFSLFSRRLCGFWYKRTS